MYCCMNITLCHLTTLKISNKSMNRILIILSFITISFNTGNCAQLVDIEVRHSLLIYKLNFKSSTGKSNTLHCCLNTISYWKL